MIMMFVGSMVSSTYFLMNAECYWTGIINMLMEGHLAPFLSTPVSFTISPLLCDQMLVQLVRCSLQSQMVLPCWCGRRSHLMKTIRVMQKLKSLCMMALSPHSRESLFQLSLGHFVTSSINVLLYLWSMWGKPSAWIRRKYYPPSSKCFVYCIFHVTLPCHM